MSTGISPVGDKRRKRCRRMRSERLRLRLDGLRPGIGLGSLDFAADGSLDECLPILGTVELKSIQCILSGQSHPDEVSDARCALIPVFHRRVDLLEKHPVSSVLVDKADPKPCNHTVVCGRQRHKCTRCTYCPKLLHGARCQGSAKRYNTLDCEVRTKRSTSILGNVPGYVPGCRLGLTRFAQTSMRRYASPKQIDVGAESSDKSSAVGYGGVAA